MKNNLNKAFSLFFIVLLLPVCFESCSNHKSKDRPDYKMLKEPLIGANRIMVKNDSDRIAGHAKRMGWAMEQTKTGLWYWIIQSAGKPKAKTGQVITLDYRVTLLNGTYCYSSDSSGPVRFKIGQGGVESGLEEAVLMLGQGDTAKFIMPPYLAHGLTGDGKKIPARAIIIYDIRVLAISN